MSDSRLESMAPKRRRMMDMILAIGGLKEESVIPPSRVAKEIDALKEELTPLIEVIIEFPHSYFAAFLDAAERTDIVNQIRDNAILSKAVSDLETALESFAYQGTEGLLHILKEVQKKSEDEIGEIVSEPIDIKTTLAKVPDLITELETSVTEFESKARVDAEAAMEELQSLTKSLEEIFVDIETKPEDSLDELQKLGTKTRYGPFLRTAAQLKRGKREGRINDERFLELLSDNILLELKRGLILFVLNNMGSKTVIQISELLNTPASDIQTAVVSMIQRGEIEMVGLDGDAPIFSRVLGKAPDTTVILKQVIQQMRAMSSTLEGDTINLVDTALQRLDPLFERLQILGSYDEAVLSDPLNQLRDSINTATEAVLSSQTSDTSEDQRLLVSAGLEAFARFRLKITLEKGPNLVSGLNVYGEKLDPEVYQQMMDSYLDNELERGIILLLIRELGALTAQDLHERTKIPQDRVFSHLLRMKRDELLITAGESHGYVLYDVPRIPSEAEIAIETIGTLALELATARVVLETAFKKLKADDIGNVASSLEIFSKARDKLADLTISGSVINEAELTDFEGTIRSAVVMTARTRAKLPSTRSKITVDDLMDVDVSTVLEEYESMMGYAPLLGFGTINWDMSKCLGCKSCEIACPEDAIKLKPVVDTPKMFEMTESEIDGLPTIKALFYKTVRGLATKSPPETITLKEESPGFGKVETNLYLCIGCRICVRRCPGPEEGALELELKWTLPEVIKQITTEN